MAGAIQPELGLGADPGHPSTPSPHMEDSNNQGRPYYRPRLVGLFFTRTKRTLNEWKQRRDGASGFQDPS